MSLLSSNQFGVQFETLGFEASFHEQPTTVQPRSLSILNQWLDSATDAKQAISLIERALSIFDDLLTLVCDADCFYCSVSDEHQTLLLTHANGKPIIIG